MSSIYNFALFSVFLIGASSISYGAQEYQLEPPKVVLSDPNGVNVISKNVGISIPTISIGGDLGLDHSVSMFTSGISLEGGNYAFMDKYLGRAKFVRLGELFGVSGSRSVPTSVYRVFGPSGTQDFKIIDSTSGEWIFSSAGPAPAKYHYEAMGDKRNTLTKVDSGLEWRTPDAVVFHFKRARSGARDAGTLDRITYPNGFTVYIEPAGSVHTNTGFMLKYEYNLSNRQYFNVKSGVKTWGALPPDKLNSFLELPENNDIPNDGAGFSTANPEVIRGVNLAYEYCDPSWSIGSTCASSTYDWPVARIQWPSGSPLALFIGNSEVSITDSKGGVTKLGYQAQDRMLDKEGRFIGTKGGNTFLPYGIGEKWASRLVSKKSDSSNSDDLFFEWKNNLQYNSTTNLYDPVLPEGELVRSKSRRGSVYYRSWEPPSSQAGQIHAEWGFGHYKVKKGDQSRFPGSLESVFIPKKGTYIYEYDRNDVDKTRRNFLERFISISNLGKSYFYDDRGNVSRIESNGVVIEEGYYPEKCTTDNEKYCNKPSWVKDAKGNRTDFTYHAESGSVESITYPEIEINGELRRPAKYFKYRKHNAYFKNKSGSISSGSPIWLVVNEFYCRSGNGSLEGCAGGELDKVDTHFYYGPQKAGTPNNLFLIGKSIQAEGNHGELETRVTCYSYNEYGHKVSETLPNSAPSKASLCP